MGGSTIGAVMYHGLIPFDDDLDGTVQSTRIAFQCSCSSLAPPLDFICFNLDSVALPLSEFQALFTLRNELSRRGFDLIHFQTKQSGLKA